MASRTPDEEEQRESLRKFMEKLKEVHDWYNNLGEYVINKYIGPKPSSPAEHILLLEAHVSGLLGYIGRNVPKIRDQIDEIHAFLNISPEMISQLSDKMLTVEGAMRTVNDLTQNYEVAQKFNDILSILPLLRNLPSLRNLSSVYETMIFEFMKEEDDFYKQYLEGEDEAKQWNIMQYKTESFLYLLRPDKRIAYILIAVMRFFRQRLYFLGDPDATRFHIGNYFKTLCELEQWIRIGLDWRMCQTGKYVNVPLAPDITWLDYIQLGKLACFRLDCLTIDNLIDLNEIYKYTFPEPNLILGNGNPFYEMDDRLLYPPDEINLSLFYTGAALCFSTKDEQLFSSMFQNRPYMALFICAILSREYPADHRPLFITDTLLNKSLPVKEKFKEIDEKLRTNLPDVYPLLPTLSHPEKWYFRALALFKDWEIKSGIWKIMTIYPTDNIELKYNIMKDNWLIIEIDEQATLD
jgi:hypothetical protein